MTTCSIDKSINTELQVAEHYLWNV